jgi:hypothetical protein
MAVLSKIVAALASALLLVSSQGPQPMTSDASGGSDMDNNFFIDYFVFNATAGITGYALLPYPTDTCNLAMLYPIKTYAKYECMMDGTVLKTTYSDNGCSVSTSNATYNDSYTGYDATKRFGYNCNGFDDMIFMLNASCDTSSSGIINLVGGVCIYSSTLSGSIEWQCGDADSDGVYDKLSVEFYYKSGATTGDCSGTPSQEFASASYSTCSAFSSTGINVQGIEDLAECQEYTTTTTTSSATTTSSGATTSSSDTTTTASGGGSGSSDASSMMINVAALLLSLVAAVMMQ